MKQTLKRLFSFSVNAIARGCLVMWIFGVFSCAAADDDRRPDNICAWISGIFTPCCCAAVDFDDKKSDDICPITLRAQEEQEEKGTINIRFLEEEKFHVQVRSSILPVARGYEAIYQRFLNGVLIYRPNGYGDDNGRINLPIRDLGNPLEGTFDLSRCSNRGNCLSISTGYRKEKRPENANKVEIWFSPRFLIERELTSTASHFKPIMGNWKQEAPVGMFWTWGGHDDLSWYDYLTTENMDNLSKINLYENWKKSVHGRAGVGGAARVAGICWPGFFMFIV